LTRRRLTCQHDYLTKLLARMRARLGRRLVHRVIGRSFRREAAEDAIAALLDTDCKTAPFLRSYGRG
jgi:hypothetical protein